MSSAEVEHVRSGRHRGARPNRCQRTDIMSSSFRGDDILDDGIAIADNVVAEVAVGGFARKVEAVEFGRVVRDVGRDRVRHLERLYSWCEQWMRRNVAASCSRAVLISFHVGLPRIRARASEWPRSGGRPSGDSTGKKPGNEFRPRGRAHQLRSPSALTVYKETQDAQRRLLATRHRGHRR